MDYTPCYSPRYERGGGDTPEDIKSYLNYIFKKYEKKYEITLDGTESLTVRFRQIIETAYEKSGHRVAILIDEYDAPLQHSWKTTYYDECTRVYKNVFAVLATIGLGLEQRHCFQNL